MESVPLAAASQAALTLQPGREFQFQLRRIQTYNWGTFDKLREIEIAAEGHLVLGPSGSGKSTLLDGHTSLLTPPRWLDFNTAARTSEKGSGDRSLATYVRGAWATQTDGEGEKVKRYLRSGTTWSAIAETYRDSTGRTIVLGRLLWIKGNGSADNDVHRLFFVAEREFGLRELESFKDDSAGFEVRRLKARLADVHFTDEFSAYQTRFTRLFQIASDRALRLLHKTQSAKDLGDLNKFLRDFMLDPPETFTVAETLVNEFQVLNAAHEAVLTARMQIEALQPVREALTQYDHTQTQLSLLEEERVGVQYWREQHRRELLTLQIHELTTKAEGMAARVEQAKTTEGNEEATFNAYLAMRAGAGGNLLSSLQNDLGQLERVRVPNVSANHDRLSRSCQALGWAPPSSPESFAQAKAEAQTLVDGRQEMEQRHEDQLDKLKDDKRTAEERFATLLSEIKAMEGRTSNMPSYLLKIREEMCRELDVSEDELPFAGELLQVKPKESQWTGSIERVLGGFATSLLVDDRHYAEVAKWVDRTHLGQRLVYLRMLPRSSSGGPVAQPAANSLIRKLDLAPNRREWLTEELRRFDYACVDSAEDLRKEEKGVTLAGQVKHSRTRHEKDDRRRVNDRSNWVLGFSNVEKLAAYKAEAAEVGRKIGESSKNLETARAAANREREQILHCQTLVNLTWENSNIAAVLDEVSSLRTRIAEELKARPELADLDKKVERQREVWNKATRARTSAQSDAKDVERDLSKAKEKLESIPAEALAVALTPTQEQRLDARFFATGKVLSPEHIDSACTSMMQAIGEEAKDATAKAGNITQKIEHQLFVFCTKWEAEAKGLDPKMESSPDFMAKLTRLETDGLHEYVARFKALLREQSDQNLAVLHAKLDQERRNIGERMEQVNDSLRRCAFNERTYLQINYDDRPTQEVLEFRAQLKAALSGSFREDDEEMERRFTALNGVVQRLGSQAPADLKWRSLVLDVRQHVVFSATEFDESKIEVETYDSGAGKSGGQRQKLTTTVLAAALRYQLAGEEGVWPTYSTVVMDEAFEKADNEFTAMVMNIFKSFGFQVVAATPVKNVMALEPFIGGGTFISIKDRKYSEALAITYVPGSGRLDLPMAAQEALVDELVREQAEPPLSEAVA
jgi:uncharacterized protein YPO0396